MNGVWVVRYSSKVVTRNNRRLGSVVMYKGWSDTCVGTDETYLLYSTVVTCTNNMRAYIYTLEYKVYTSTWETDIVGYKESNIIAFEAKHRQVTR